MVHWEKQNITLYVLSFKKRVAHNVHSFKWVFSAPNIQNETAYIEFIEKAINAQLPDHLEEPKIFELVKTYQVHAHSRTCWKYSKNEIVSQMVDILLRRQLLQNPLILNLAMLKKKMF